MALEDRALARLTKLFATSVDVDVADVMQLLEELEVFSPYREAEVLIRWTKGDNDEEAVQLLERRLGELSNELNQKVVDLVIAATLKADTQDRVEWGN